MAFATTMGRALRILTVLLLLGLLAAGGVAYWAWQRLEQPFQGHDGERIVLIESGQSAAGILHRLADEGVLADPLLARLYLVYWRGDPPLQAGEYLFDRPLDAPAVLDKLIRGDVLRHPVTLIEGLTLDEVATALAAAGLGDVEVFRREVHDPGRIADLDPAAEDLEGYLYPETYHFVRGTPEAKVIDTLVATFRERWKRDVEPLLGRAPEAVRRPRDLVTLASIVERETQAEAERRLVASVYANRLERGIALYADPTIIYALKRQGSWDGNLRRRDLRLDSPYNTYRHAGLPPGPICSPSVASMVAAADPAATDYLYFVSRNDGTHVFSETYAEHRRNVERWQRRYWRERWAEEKRAAADAAPPPAADPP